MLRSHRIRSMPEEITRWAALQPDAPALGATNGHILTFADLAREIAALRRQLRALGIDRQDRIAIALPNGPRSTVLFAAVLASCTLVPVPPGTPPAELAAILPRLRLAAVLSLGSLPSAVTDHVCPAAHALGIPVLQVIPRSLDNPFTSTLLGNPIGPPAPDRPETLDDIALILSTSGSTGRAKLVPKTHRNITCSQRLEVVGVDPTDRTAIVAPISHALAQGNLRRALCEGSFALCPEPSDLHLDHLPDLIGLWKLTWLGLPAPMLPRVIGATAPAGPRLCSTIRAIQTGSATLDDSIRSRVSRIFGVPIYNHYGSSEGGGIAYEGIHAPHRTGTVGRIVCPLRIMEDGRQLLDGEPGEIQISGDSVVPGYWDDPDATARAFLPDGWFRTGDLGIVRDGYLTLLGRLDDRINVAGLKVDPEEIETLLRTHHDVQDAAVFAIPSDTTGQRVAAAIVVRPGVPPDRRALRRWLLDRLSAHKIPVVLLFLDALPKTDTGKIDRASLIALAETPKPTTLRSSPLS